MVRIDQPGSRSVRREADRSTELKAGGSRTAEATTELCGGDREDSERASIREEARLAAVRRYDVLDTPPDGAFDRITRLAARLFDVPIAVVSIVDEDRIWFKSRHGLDVDGADRHPGLCASAIIHHEPWVVTDAATDPRAMANPLVAGASGFRFYAGAPLKTTDGHNLGTLCVIDVEPRSVSGAELATLTELAAMVVDELELRRAASRAVGLEHELRCRAEELASVLQTSLLPPVLPTVPGAEVAALYRPADRAQVGGDFYDVFPVDDRTWGVMIGDVCGKGPVAASRSALARFSLRAAAVHEPSPATALDLVNRAMLAGAGPEDPFCSLVFALIERVADGLNVRLAVGGHPLPAVLRRDGTVSTVGLPGSLVGLFTDPQYNEDEVRLESGDTLVLVTDGLLEIRTERGVVGRREFDVRVADCAGLATSALVDRLAAAVNLDHDDMAILAVRAL